MATTDVVLEGVVSVVPTPFREDESIDYDALASCIQFACEVGLSAVCLPAWGSEFYKLSDAERGKVVETAVQAAEGRVGIVAQSGHTGASKAAEMARENEARGADLITVVLPRQLPVSESELLAYAKTVCSAVRIPVLLQDWNPGGPTIGADFSVRLLDACPNFRYLKLEEPLLAPKVIAIREATADRVGILEGWGAMYLMELIETGICGTMPGLGMADLLQEVWRSAKAGEEQESWTLFEKLAPHISFSLQDFELFLWMEKDLLARRGVIPATATHVRSVTNTPDSFTWRHAVKLNERVLSIAKQQVRT